MRPSLPTPMIPSGAAELRRLRAHRFTQKCSDTPPNRGCAHERHQCGVEPDPPGTADGEPRKRAGDDRLRKENDGRKRRQATKYDPPVPTHKPKPLPFIINCSPGRERRRQSNDSNGSGACTPPAPTKSHGRKPPATGRRRHSRWAFRPIGPAQRRSPYAAPLPTRRQLIFVGH